MVVDNGTTMFTGNDVDMQVKHALTEKAELEVMYIQRIAFLEKGKRKIVSELKEMLQSRDENIAKLHKKIEEMELNKVTSNTVVDLPVVSPEKQRQGGIIFDDAPDDEMRVMDQIETKDKHISSLKSVILQLESELNDARTEADTLMADSKTREVEVETLKAEVKSIKAEITSTKIVKPAGREQTTTNSGPNKYGEKIRLAKARQRLNTLENQLKVKTKEIEDMKKDKTLEFELEARDVAIKLLAENKDKEIAFKDEEIRELKSSVDSFRRENESLSTRLSAADACGDEDGINVDELKAKLHDTEKSLESAKMIIASLEKSKNGNIEDLKAKLATSNERVASLEKELEVNEAATSAKSELEKHKRIRLEEKMATETEMAGLRQEALATLTKLDEKDQELEDLRQKLEDISNRSGDKEGQTFAKQVEELDEAMHHIRLQIASSNQVHTNNHLTDALAKAGNALEKVTEKFESQSVLIKQLELKDNEISNLKETMNQSSSRTANFDDVESQLKKALLENNYMKVENTLLKQEKETSVSALKEELMESNEAKRKLTEQLEIQLRQLESVQQMMMNIDKSEEFARADNTKKQDQVENNTSDTLQRRQSNRSWTSMHEQLSAYLPKCISNVDGEEVQLYQGNENMNEI